MSSDNDIKSEPNWVSRNFLDAMHAALIERYGGSPGVHDEGLIESALARPMNLFAYHPKSDICDLAASLAFGLAKNHGFSDGNKRTALAAAAMFLRLNGLKFIAAETETVVAMVCLATDEWSEKQFADWLRAHVREHATGPTPPKSR